MAELPEIEGHATPEATREHARLAVSSKKAAAHHYRSSEGLSLSSVGLGTYLGDADEETDREVERTVRRALASGTVNVLDTAINYRHQRAERSVGRGLRAAIDHDGLLRSAVFISTKNGYLAPDAESGLSPRAYIQQELIGTGALRPEDIVEGSHAMSVPYLRDQLARSLRNLGLSTVDLLYLHNAPDAQLATVGPEVFRERLRSAFEFYEEARTKGRIRWYGLATWDALRRSRHEEGYLALEEAVATAHEAGGASHGFRFLQFPFNLMMTEAAQVRNQSVKGERFTLLEAAHRLGLGTFSSVPLLQGQLARGHPVVPGRTPAQGALQFARSAPHHLAPLVGVKGEAHLEEDLAIAREDPLPATAFSRLLP